MTTTKHDAAALWGVSGNLAYDVRTRLMAATRALEFFGGEFEKLETLREAVDGGAVELLSKRPGCEHEKAMWDDFGIGAHCHRCDVAILTAAGLLLDPLSDEQVEELVGRLAAKHHWVARQMGADATWADAPGIADDFVASVVSTTVADTLLVARGELKVEDFQ